MQTTTACFVGHKTIRETAELTAQLTEVIEYLILHEKIDTFLFGSNSRFDSLCHELVTQLRQTYPHIRRIYVRASYPYISDMYREYLLQSYEDTLYPERLCRAGRAAYVERNFDMILRSRICIVYYDQSYAPTSRKSGAKIALDYALKQQRQVILFPRDRSAPPVNNLPSIFAL